MPIRSQWASTPGLCIVVLFLGCMWWLFVRFLLEVLDIGSSVKKIKKHAQYSFFFFFLYYDIILLNSSFQPDDVLTRKLDCNGIFLRTSRKEGECRKPKMHKFKETFLCQKFSCCETHRRHREKLIAHGISIIDQCFQKKKIFLLVGHFVTAPFLKVFKDDKKVLLLKITLFCGFPIMA